MNQNGFVTLVKKAVGIKAKSASSCCSVAPTQAVAESSCCSPASASEKQVAETSCCGGSDSSCC